MKLFFMMQKLRKKVPEVKDDFVKSDKLDCDNYDYEWPRHKLTHSVSR